MNTISKIGSTHFTALQQKANDPLSPSLTPVNRAHRSTVPPSLNTTTLSVPGNADNASLGLSEHQLKRLGLECLVAVLRSLVVWGTAARKSAAQDMAESIAQTQASQDNVDGMTSDASLDKLSSAPDVNEPSRVPTPEVSDDPGKFESAKQRKTTLLEGIKKFNFKPKKVR